MKNGCVVVIGCAKTSVFYKYDIKKHIHFNIKCEECLAVVLTFSQLSL